MTFAERFNAMKIQVYYPGLGSHPQHELAKRMMNAEFGYGGMMSIELQKRDLAEKFVQKLQDLGGGLNAVSLGYFDTLASIPGATTSSEIDSKDQKTMGLSKGLVRLSIGYTGNIEAQWDKMEKAIKYAK